MLRRAWKPLAATAAIGGSTYWYLYARKEQETFDLLVPSATRDANRQRQMETKAIPLLSMESAEGLIRKHASFHSEQRPNGLVWKHTTAFMPSNDPIEDAFSHQIIQRDGASDLVFFTVMDGHGGFETSKVLSKVLINAVALQLSTLSKAPPAPSIFSFKKAPPIFNPSDPGHVAFAIQEAFVNLDSELTKAPIRLLKEEMSKQQPLKGDEPLPDLSNHPSALSVMLPAISGSCALMAVFDTANRDLYVACTGDSRAVAGCWEPSADGKGPGVWRVDVLSNDQTAEIPAEVNRLRAEHPNEPNVVSNGRILGGLQPSRAFGDARYKWTSEMQQILYEAFLAGTGRTMRKPSSSLLTPPYVTAKPEVTHRKLSFDAATPGSLRFLVLATDGLWDVLGSEEVVALVGGHFAGLKGSISKSALSTVVPTAINNAGTEGKHRRRSKDKETWSFVDDNVSTHLIRNALGGGDELALRKLVSIPSPHSRRFRDDITVTVVWWEEGHESEAQVKSIKSKL